MEDLYAVLGETRADAGNTPYPVALFWLARQQLARALRWHRVLNGWSQEALGLAAGLDCSYVGAVERMEVNISMDNAEKLARAFGVELVDLLAKSKEDGGI